MFLSQIHIVIPNNIRIINATIIRQIPFIQCKVAPNALNLH